jgi:sugar O-acyltransferase (sialic acid O-acetyltransferase NeuD family)
MESRGRKFLVYGSGGHGKVVADAAISAGFSLGGFVDDNEAAAGREVLSAPVLSWARWLQERQDWAGVPFALGVGDNAARERVMEKLRLAGAEVITVLHRGSFVAPSALIGAGCVLMAGAAVNPEAVVGAGSILNTGCVVEHDCVLGNFVHLSPNAALGGGVHIGARTHIGLCAAVLPLVRIGADVRVGAGAAVIRDVADGLTVIGVPARPLAG